MNEKGMDLAEAIRREEKARFPMVKEDPWRLRFHLMPSVGWLNDPNGLCQADGIYHVFFQYAPFDPEGGTKVWGHYESADLLNWKYCGTPLVTDEPFDRDGVYSGCAWAQEDGISLFYTGNVKHRGDYDYILSGREAVVAAARSRDGIRFEKNPRPLLTQKDFPESYTLHVRDPKICRRDQVYYMVLGGRKKSGAGAALLYESQDLERWSLKRELETETPFGYMWECPDLFETGGGWFLSVSPQGLARGKYESQNVYTAGWFSVKGDFRGDCRLEGFTEWDKGFDFYAPQTFRDESGRTILIGWAGLPDIRDEYENPTAQRGWQHALTVPRQISEKDGELLSFPVREIDLLRKDGRELTGRTQFAAPEAFDLEIDLEEGADFLSVSIAEGLTFRYNGRETELSFQRDGENAGFSGIGRGRGTRRALTSGLRSVRILADTSMVEIFLDRGRQVFTARYYPEGKGRTVRVSGSVRRMTCWDMDAMRVDYGGMDGTEI